MIGKFVKKTWKNWPSEETMIYAEDLNRHEDAIKEHDDRLAQLVNIDKDVEANKKSIKQLENMSKASDYANANVIATEEEKEVGTFAGIKVCQKGFRINDTNKKTAGTVTIQDAIVSDESHSRNMLDVSVTLRDGAYGRQYCGNGYGNAKIESYYDPITHAVIIDYSGMSTSTKTFFVNIRYTKETA